VRRTGLTDLLIYWGGVHRKKKRERKGRKRTEFRELKGQRLKGGRKLKQCEIRNVGSPPERTFNGGGSGIGDRGLGVGQEHNGFRTGYRWKEKNQKNT